MKVKLEKMKTFDRTILNLCQEVDYWKEQAETWKQKYEEQFQETMQFYRQQNDEAMKGVANALMFALSVTDNENGDLVISKEDRKLLADQYK